jgi:hypothetical protein
MSNGGPRLLALALAVAASAAAAPAQQRRVIRPREQIVFSSGMPLHVPVGLPEDVVRQLSEFEDGQLGRCLKENGETLSDVAKHFSATKVGLNGDDVRDIVVQAESSCFMGAHLTTWWLFRNRGGKSGAKGAPAYDLILSVRGDGLSIYRTETKGLRDVETVSIAGAGSQLYTAVWKFDGREYRRRLCAVVSGGKKVRVECDR